MLFGSQWFLGNTNFFERSWMILMILTEAWRTMWGVHGSSIGCGFWCLASILICKKCAIPCWWSWNSWQMMQKTYENIINQHNPLQDLDGLYMFIPPISGKSGLAGSIRPASCLTRWDGKDGWKPGETWKQSETYVKHAGLGEGQSSRCESSPFPDQHCKYLAIEPSSARWFWLLTSK